jgi:hypothetical protein
VKLSFLPVVKEGIKSNVMKKSTNILAITTLMMMTFSTFANITNHIAINYKPIIRAEVNLEVDRMGEEVMLYVYSQSLSNVDMIMVEKSKNANDGFTSCRNIKVNESFNINNRYIESSDVTPYPSNVDTYYRIVTVSKSGVTKVYPAINLNSFAKNDILETVEK